MKGKILDYNIQESKGVISGDDGQRYSFENKDWKASELPKVNQIVDFEVDELNALEIYLVKQSSYNSIPQKLDQYGVTISHSGKGNCYDNAACENFFSHLKSESLRLFPPEDRETLVHQIREYINWYNDHRPQEKLKGMTPLEFREAYLLKT